MECLTSGQKLPMNWSRGKAVGIYRQVMVTGRGGDMSFSGRVTGLVGQGEIIKGRIGQETIMRDEDEQSILQKSHIEPIIMYN